jgi:hypothetical protein
MKSKLAILAGGALAASLVTGCGGGSSGGGTMTPPPTPPPSSNLALDTAQVLALAQQTSETESPLPVDDNGVTLTDTSETSSPIAVAPM